MCGQKADKINKVKGFGANQGKQQEHSFIKPQPPGQNKPPQHCHAVCDSMSH